MEDLFKNPYVLGAAAFVVVVSLVMGRASTGNTGNVVMQSQSLAANTNVALAKINSANLISGNSYAAQTAIANTNAQVASSSAFLDFLVKSHAQDTSTRNLKIETAAALEQAKIKSVTDNNAIGASIDIAKYQLDTSANQQKLSYQLAVHNSDNQMLSSQIMANAQQAIASSNNQLAMTIAQSNAETQRMALDNQRYMADAQTTNNAMGMFGSIAGMALQAFL